jgi:hypothetical protein
MATKKTKLQKLVGYLEQVASKQKTVNRKTIERRFRGDPSFVVYFNGLRRNGAITPTGSVKVSKIKSAIKSFRKENRQRQIEHYNRRGIMTA